MKEAVSEIVSSDTHILSVVYSAILSFVGTAVAEILVVISSELQIDDQDENGGLSNNLASHTLKHAPVF